MIINDKFWSIYILAKHLCEIVVLTLELFISTAIKSYDTRRTSTETLNTGRSVGAVVGPGAGIHSYGATNISSSSSNYLGTGGSGGARRMELSGVSETTPMLQRTTLYSSAGANEV